LKNKQNELYNNIAREDKVPMKKVYVNSVLNTFEGITEHARNEIKQLDKLGYEINYNDTLFNKKYWGGFVPKLTPIDIENDDYITYVNQPPYRNNNMSLSLAGSRGLKNIVYFLAVESKLPKDAVDVINATDIKLFLTPSEFSRKLLIESGVKHPIKILHHGVDDLIYKQQAKQLNRVFDKETPFRFVSCITSHNKRKGYDCLIKAFNEEFKPNENVELVFKVNKIYDRKQDFESEILKYSNKDGNNNIKYIEMELSEDEMATLLSSAEVYVSASRCEGFGIIPLEAMAVGTPVITTLTGESEYANKDNALIVDFEEKKTLAPQTYPYVGQMWNEPSVDSLRKQLREVYTNYNKYYLLAQQNSKEIIDKFSWNVVGKQMDAYFKEI
jgi:glycosyltransferase involved in cell wall biosynthesis